MYMSNIIYTFKVNKLVLNKTVLSFEFCFEFISGFEIMSSDLKCVGPAGVLPVLQPGVFRCCRLLTSLYRL